jgi:hypothetical protein
LVARELYDHQADPQENENVAGVPANAALVETLAAQLRSARETASSPQAGRGQQRPAEKIKAAAQPTSNRP